MKKKAIITGIMGQDGSYLAKLLLKKNYTVFGTYRKSSYIKNNRLEKLKIKKKVKLLNLNIRNIFEVKQTIKKIKPNEIYNLAAVASVKSSFAKPIYTMNVNCISLLNILESVKEFSKNTKIYQASSSEMFGNSKKYRINEKTSFSPVSPYGISKVAAHYLIKFYRDAYKIKCSSGILFNHESILRGKNFVTKKIVKQLHEIKNKKRSVMYLGNIYSKRDWGFAPEYVEAMWKILQLKKPEDFVIATGRSYTIKYFVNLACKYLKISSQWRGKGINEVCLNKKTKKNYN